MKRFIVQFLIGLGLIWQVMTPAYAVLDLELTKGMDSAIPIAIVPFAGQDRVASLPVNIHQVVSQDLLHSGRFSLLNPQLFDALPTSPDQVDLAAWRQKNIEHLIVGNIRALGNDQYQITYSLIDLYQQQSGEHGTAIKNSVILTQELVVRSHELRRLAHHISDMLYEALTGDKGVFSTQIAYVLVQPGQPTHYVLEVADMDGYNPRAIMRSNEPIMSPSWSPDGQKLAYVSFENKRPRIYISDIVTGKRRMMTSFPGINGAPSWSPDSRKLALALSEGYNPNLYILDTHSGNLTQLTRDSAINTEPSWTPDGKAIIFTSDRGGSPQIYRLALPGNTIERLTFEGNYNASPSISPDGKMLALLHRTHRGFSIATFDIAQGNLQILTDNGFEESPSFAPNGKMIVYSTRLENRQVLGIVSTDGRVRLQLPNRNGNVQEPVWSPFAQ